MLSVRLSSAIEKALNEYCESNGLAKSQVVKEALTLYLNNENKTIHPYEVGSDLFGQEGSGVLDKSTTYKNRLTKLLNEKHSY